ncbi:S8 family serine peptidase [Sphingomonadaceae bacterium LXI357]|uniref:S8 family serine peptidase n=2 Tax=Stakelama marina TaxID=2826939 RepID=A0A8T4IJZ5_9SPHN|nr:S8 family serine peptidase [Stakelama marina]
MAAAQLVPSLPLPGGVGDTVGRIVPEVRRDVSGLTDLREVRRTARRLVRDRVDRLAALAQAHPDAIALDRHGNPVRAGEVVVDDPDDAIVDAARQAGFALIERARIAGVDIGFARFRVPPGHSLDDALESMKHIARGHDVSTDPLHFESGALSPAPLEPRPATSAPSRATSPMLRRIGIIDGGANAAAVGARMVQKGFATGAPRISDHGTAVASLIAGGSGIRRASPAAQLYVADVYGSDPAGGNATAIAKALGWMVAEQVPVVSVSLVGPENPLLARVVKAARTRGTVVVAAVGNDGPAAPPAYPASYDGVVAVTAVDGKDRALIEAGRARHLDYAAPGADMLAANGRGRAVPVRGTSFAAPLVAATLARAYAAPDDRSLSRSLRTLDHEAVDLGRHGPDKVFGRGLLCGDCRTTG